MSTAGNSDGCSPRPSPQRRIAVQWISRRCRDFMVRKDGIGTSARRAAGYSSSPRCQVLQSRGDGSPNSGFRCSLSTTRARTFRSLKSDRAPLPARPAAWTARGLTGQLAGFPHVDQPVFPPRFLVSAQAHPDKTALFWATHRFAIIFVRRSAWVPGASGAPWHPAGRPGGDLDAQSTGVRLRAAGDSCGGCGGRSSEQFLKPAEGFPTCSPMRVCGSSWRMAHWHRVSPPMGRPFRC